MTLPPCRIGLRFLRVPKDLIDCTFKSNHFNVEHKKAGRKAAGWCALTILRFSGAADQ